MTSTFRGVGVKAKIKCYRTQGVGSSECYGRPIFIFFIKENWICAMNRHYAESNINILLTRNLPVEPDVIQ